MHKSQSQEMCDPFCVDGVDTSWVRLRCWWRFVVEETKIRCFVMGWSRATGGTRFIGTGKQWENAANYLTLSKTTIELIWTYLQIAGCKHIHIWDRKIVSLSWRILRIATLNKDVEFGQALTCSNNRRLRRARAFGCHLVMARIFVVSREMNLQWCGWHT